MRYMQAHGMTPGKTSFCALALCGALSSTACAQSSVTIYGVIDTAVRFISNADAAGDNKISMGNGAFQGSRVGFRGQEDLGNGDAAVFQFESGFSPTTGASGQQGQLFGLAAFAGLRDPSLGEIDVGRQIGLAFQTLSNDDPVSNGVANEMSWQIGIEGNRFDNSIEYTNNFGAVKVQAQYSAGGSAGSTGIGATTAVDLIYAAGPLSIGGVHQQSQDLNAKNAVLSGLGGYYTTGSAKWTLSYFDAKRDPGFAPAANLSGGPLANTSLTSNAGNTLQRTDDVWTAGVVLKATPAASFTLAYMYDSVRNDTSAGAGGSIGTCYGVADYYLSRRTDVYLELDRTRLGGGEITDANAPVGTFSGNKERAGLSLGLRMIF